MRIYILLSRRAVKRMRGALITVSLLDLIAVKAIVRATLQGTLGTACAGGWQAVELANNYGNIGR